MNKRAERTNGNAKYSKMLSTTSSNRFRPNPFYLLFTFIRRLFGVRTAHTHMPGMGAVRSRQSNTKDIDRWHNAR